MNTTNEMLNAFNNAANTVIDFTNGGQLATVSMRGWTATVSDRALSAQVADTQQAAPEAIRASHELFPSIGSGKSKQDSFPELSALRNHRATVANTMKRILRPWDGSTGYLPHFDLPAFTEAVDTLRTDLDRLKRAITPEVYAERISAAAFLRKGFFDREQYPDLDAMLSKFSLDVLVHEVPQGDFRNVVCADSAANLKREFDRTMQQRIDAIQSDVSRTLIDYMESIIHGCGHTETTRKRDGSTYLRANRVVESTYQNLLRMCESIGQLNPTRNAALEQARLGLLAALAGPDGQPLPIEALRDSESTRASVKAQLEGVLQQFAPAAPLIDADEVY